MTTTELLTSATRPPYGEAAQEIERPVGTREAAEIVGYSASTLEKLRCQGGGPPYHQRTDGGRVLYMPSELRKWRDRFKRSSTSETRTPQPQAA